MKHYLIIFLAVISTSLFVGCDTEEETYRPNFVTFEDDALELTVNENSSATLEVTVYTGNLSGSERTFTIEVVDTLSTLNAEAYSLPSSVTIPADTNEATFSLEVADNNLPASGGILVLELEGDAISGEPLTVDVSKFCPFDAATFTGTYENNSGFAGGTFNVEIEEGSAPGEYVVKDLYAVGTDITFTLNDDMTISVPYQNAWVHADYGQASVEGVGGSRLNTCTGVVTLIVEHTVSAGTFGEMTEVLTPATDTGEETDGEDTDGEDTDGEDTDGEDTDGEETDGDDTDGDDTDGDDTDGDNGEDEGDDEE